MIGIGTIISAANGCKRAVETLQRIRKVPHHVSQLAILVAALDQPMRLAVRLQCRHRTAFLVGDAVLAVVHAVALYEATMLPDGDAEVDAEAADWWERVPGKRALALGVSNASRLSHIPAVRDAVSAATACLHLALATVALEIDDPQARRGAQPYGVNRHIIENAISIFELLEMGRLGRSTQNRYPLCAAAVTTTDGPRRRAIGNHAVLLVRHDSGTYAIELLRPATSDEAEEGASATAAPAVVVPFIKGGGSGGISLDTLGRVEVAEDHLHQGSVAYALARKYELQFVPLPSPQHGLPAYPAPGDERYFRVTHEILEALLVMASGMAEKGVTCVAEYDDHSVIEAAWEQRFS